MTSVPDFRAAAPAQTLIQQLGPLSELPGTWKGHGFNLIARPDFEGGNDIFLKLNPTDEELKFSAIGGAIPNRGSVMNDIELFGVTYLQQISDHDTGGAIHIEPGIWLNIPATTAPALDASVARLATIPHGNAVVLEGRSLQVNGPPQFTPANTVPFPIGGAAPPPGTANGFAPYNLGAPNPFRTALPTPTPITQEMVTNPNSVLAADVATEQISTTTVMIVAGAEQNANNIPFLVTNADVGAVSATFWIETVQRQAPYAAFLQLQYTQTVLLNFLGLSWPHVTVATLLKVT